MAVNDLFIRAGSFQKWQEPSAFDRKAEAEKAREANYAKVCAFVTKRDERRCRVCRRLVEPHAMSKTQRGHHHHIQLRSKGRLDESHNLVLLCASDHDLIHVKRTLRVEGNADVALTVWALDVEANTWYVLIQEDAPGVPHHD